MLIWLGQSHLQCSPIIVVIDFVCELYAFDVHLQQHLQCVLRKQQPVSGATTYVWKLHKQCHNAEEVDLKLFISFLCCILVHTFTIYILSVSSLFDFPLIVT